MARRRAFDHELLRRLMVEHPDWSDERYRQILEDDNRRRGEGTVPLKLGTVQSEMSRSRLMLKSRGVTVPWRGATYTFYMPPPHTVPDEYQNATEFRYLRHLEAHENGVMPTTESGRKMRSQAINWANQTMNVEKCLIDLTGDGQPIKRHPVAGERDSTGRPVVIAAWMLPRWRA